MLPNQHQADVKLEDLAVPINSELLAEQPDIFPGFVPKDDLVCISSGTNQGKSLISVEICSSLSTGEPLWGSITPSMTAKKILYVLGEHRTRKIVSLARKTRLPFGNVLVLGPEHLSVDKYLVSHGVVNMRSVDRFRRWADGVDFIVFDPLAAFIAGADVEDDSIQMRLLIETINQICMSSGASCLVLAHHGKPQMDPKGYEHHRKTYAIRGASGSEDTFTNIFYLNQSEQGPSVFELTMRKFKGDGHPKFKLARNRETLVHTLISDVSSQADVLKAEARAKVTNLRYDFPHLEEEMIHKLTASFMGIPVDTLERRLGMRK